MLGCLFELRFEHAHLCRAHVALLHHRIGDDLQEQCDEYEHDAHVDVQTCEEVEHVECEPTVDDAEEWPAEVDETLHLQVFAEGALLLHVLKQTEVVGSEVEVKLRGCLA